MVPAYSDLSTVPVATRLQIFTCPHRRAGQRFLKGQALQEIIIEDNGKTLAIKSEYVGICGKIFPACYGQENGKCCFTTSISMFVNEIDFTTVKLELRNEKQISA